MRRSKDVLPATQNHSNTNIAFLPQRLLSMSLFQRPCSLLRESSTL